MTEILKDLDEMAMDYAMLASETYDSESFGGDSIENHQRRLLHQMRLRFGAYDVQEAIKKAQQILSMMAFHPKEEP